MCAQAARRVSPLDWFMVVLAVGSVALLLLATFGDLPVRRLLLLFWVDLGVCVLFAPQFLGRRRRAGHYARNLARAVDENKHELRQLVVDKIKADPQAGRLRVLPFHDEIVGGIADTVLRVVMEMLNDPRTDEMIADALRENVDQIR